MGSLSSRFALATLASFALFSLGACGSSSDDGGTGPGQPTPPVAAATVTLGLSSFSPSQVRLLPAGIVTWNNASGVTHNVTFQGAGTPANIPNHSSGTNERAFPSVGVFNYSCTIHAGMTGRVTVVAP